MNNAARFAQQGLNARMAAATLAGNIAATRAKQTAQEAARLTSYAVPTNVLTASDAGLTASIAIAAHTRVYPVQGAVDVPDVAVAGGSITGLAFNTIYYVYYDDLTQADTTPTYLATTSSETAAQGFAPGRHLVGQIKTPVDGGSTSSGGGVKPGGWWWEEPIEEA